MSYRARLQVALPPDLEDFVASTVAAGRYASESEVVRAGLRLLSEQDRRDDRTWERLRKDLQAGLDQALRGELVEGGEVFDSLERGISG